MPRRRSRESLTFLAPAVSHPFAACESLTNLQQVYRDLICGLTRMFNVISKISFASAGFVVSRDESGNAPPRS